MCVKVSREHAEIAARINEITSDGDVSFVVILRNAGGDLTFVKVGSTEHPETVIKAKVDEHRSYVVTINFYEPIDEQIAAILPYWGEAATVDTDRELVTA